MLHSQDKDVTWTFNACTFEVIGALGTYFIMGEASSGTISWVDQPAGDCPSYTGGPIPTEALSISGTVDDDPTLGFVAKTLSFITPDGSDQAQQFNYTVQCGGTTEDRVMLPNVVEPVSAPPLWQIPLETPFKTIKTATPYPFNLTFTPPDEPTTLLTVQGTLRPRYKLAVDLNPSELDPIAQNPNSTATVTMTIGGLPARDEVVDIKACTKVDPDNDGHTHDRRADPCDNTRPAGKLDNQNQYPVKKTTGQDGTFTMNYTPPQTGKYYISGTDTITVTLDRDDTVQDKEDLITRVPNLSPMPGSASCVGGGTYYFVSQANHGCLFYGTSTTNDALVKIANDFAQYQVDFRNGGNFADPVTNQNVQVTTPANNPKPIRITAMSLPWGGLLDAGPNSGIPNAQFWNPPHSTHDRGNAVDISLRDYTTTAGGRDMDLVLLLRFVVYSNGGSCPYPNEGLDLTPNGQTLTMQDPNGPGRIPNPGAHLHVLF